MISRSADLQVGICRAEARRYNENKILVSAHNGLNPQAERAWAVLISTISHEMTKPGVVIKKYSDRRLYDTSSSGYVTLDDIARMVREGIDVQVKDARSGKDLTSMVLTQIIVENARERDTALPLQLLRQLVRASDRATHDFVSWYLATTFDLYQKAQETASARFPEATALLSRPVEFVRSLLADHPWPPAADTGEVERLRARVSELEKQLAEREKPRRRAVKSKPGKKARAS